MQNSISCSARATPDIKQIGVTWDKKNTPLVSSKYGITNNMKLSGEQSIYSASVKSLT